MWLLVGLGNPGDEYADTRHNIGFKVIDVLSERFSIPVKKKTTNYVYGRGLIEDQRVILMKPLTYMNRSGFAVREMIWKNDDIDNFIIIYDDLDLEPGIMRIKKTGSSGGHNGIQSIIDYMNSKDFVRIKVGIGRPKRGAAEKYVLKPFSKLERPIIEETIVHTAEAVQCIMTKGIPSTQNKYHSIRID